MRRYKSDWLGPILSTTNIGTTRNSPLKNSSASSRTRLTNSSYPFSVPTISLPPRHLTCTLASIIFVSSRFDSFFGGPDPFWAEDMLGILECGVGVLGCWLLMVDYSNELLVWLLSIIHLIVVACCVLHSTVMYNTSKNRVKNTAVGLGVDTLTTTDRGEYATTDDTKTQRHNKEQ